eukprot:2567960-Pyramimonas_sp.AAC.1
MKDCTRLGKAAPKPSATRAGKSALAAVPLGDESPLGTGGPIHKQPAELNVDSGGGNLDVRVPQTQHACRPRGASAPSGQRVFSSPLGCQACSVSFELLTRDCPCIIHTITSESTLTPASVAAQAEEGMEPSPGS